MTYVEEACSNIFWSQSFSMSQWVTAICSSTLFLRYRIVTQSIVCTPPSSLWWTVVKMPCQSLPMNIWWDLDPEQWDRVDQPSFLRPSDRSPLLLLLLLLLAANPQTSSVFFAKDKTLDSLHSGGVAYYGTRDPALLIFSLFYYIFLKRLNFWFTGLFIVSFAFSNLAFKLENQVCFPTKYLLPIRYSSWLFNFKFLKLDFVIILSHFRVFRFPRARFLGDNFY